MADPLGMIGGSMHGAGGAGGIGGVKPGVGAPGQQPQAGEPSFQDALQKGLDNLNSAQQEADAAIENLAAGNRTDVEGVLLAAQKADMAFKMALAMRNKMQNAFEELKQVRI